MGVEMTRRFRLIEMHCTIPCLPILVQPREREEISSAVFIVGANWSFRRLSSH
jgi:hypothetical protein